MKKYYNAVGKVAVIYSPSYGAGWSTWSTHNVEEKMFDPTIVQMLIGEIDAELISEYAENTYPKSCNLAAYELEVEFLDPGTQFHITEYDGSETIEILDNVNWVVA